MKSAAVERLESLLVARKFGTTLAPAEGPDPVAQTTSTGRIELDLRLGGGWPCGHISEIVGPRSSGRTSVLVSTLAAATEMGAVAALVDTFDRFDPGSAASAGLDLGRLLWVRGAALTVEHARPAVIEEAVHRAIRAFDLVIRAGGFAVVALDLADVPGRYVRMLPHATWLRLAHANEGRTTAGILVGEAPMGRSARGVSLALEGQRAVWEGNSPQQRVMKRFRSTTGTTGTSGTTGTRNVLTLANISSVRA